MREDSSFQIDLLHESPYVHQQVADTFEVSRHIVVGHDFAQVCRSRTIEDDDVYHFVAQFDIQAVDDAFCVVYFGI